MITDEILNELYIQTLTRLQELIRTQSFSREEENTALLFEHWMQQDGVLYNRNGNNVWAKNKYFDNSKPTILLNSHIDTVKPNPGYTKNPFEPDIEDGKLYGLGSNDAGGALMCLYATFQYIYHQENLKYNFIFAATAEEEISGTNGVESLISDWGNVDLAIVGEPTQMHLAVAEKGLLVIDCIARGRAGHAAREEGDNAIYKALKDIQWFQNYIYPKKSEALGDIKMSVTMIEAGTQHNVVPAECKFTVDIRCTDAYTHEEILQIIQENITSDITPRSLRLRPSAIPMNHPLVQAGIKLGRNTYGSPTTSDQALMPYTSIKIGPGDSARSHQADEYIYTDELKEGIQIYIQLLNEIIY